MAAATASARAISTRPTRRADRREHATLTRHRGARPQGWLGPWISESRVTPDLLQEAGYAYLLDWCQDDQPVWFRTRRGRILSVPYPQEINDIPAIVARQMSAPDFADMIVDQFDEMLRQSREQPLVMGVALHPYIVGQPHRLRHLRRALGEIAAKRDALWLTTPGAIAYAIAARVAEPTNDVGPIAGRILASPERRLSCWILSRDRGAQHQWQAPRPNSRSRGFETDINANRIGLAKGVRMTALGRCC